MTPMLPQSAPAVAVLVHRWQYQPACLGYQIAFDLARQLYAV